MIRVLHIVTDMNCGGIETMLMNYYRHIDRKKIQFDFLEHRMYKSFYDDEIELLGGRIYHISPLNPISRNYYKSLGKFFDEHHYNIVHCHMDCMSVYPLLVAKKAGVPVRLAHAHSTNQDKDWKYLIKGISKNWISHYATDLFACSAVAGEWMFHTSKVHVMKNAIDCKKYIVNQETREKIRKELKCDDSLVIGHVGRFSYPKNHGFLLDVFYEIHKIRKDVKLLLVGGGQRQDEYKKKAETLNLRDYVIFAGVRSNVNELLMAMDIFVFPSLYEGLPVSMVEAQASGLPCVMSDRVPKDCIVTKELVTVKSLSDTSKDWATYILNIAKNERKDHHIEIINSGFDIENESLELEKFYEQCV